MKTALLLLCVLIFVAAIPAMGIKPLGGSRGIRRLNMDIEKALDVSSLDDRDESQETPEDESDDVENRSALERQEERERGACNPSCPRGTVCVGGRCKKTHIRGRQFLKVVEDRSCNPKNCKGICTKEGKCRFRRWSK